MMDLLFWAKRKTSKSHYEMMSSLLHENSEKDQRMEGILR
jgi:hypothetical protein